MSAPSSLAVEITAQLEPLLGPHTAARALALACEKLGMTPDSIELGDVTDLTAELVPMLRTLLGRAAAERVKANILKQAGQS